MLRKITAHLAIIFGGMCFVLFVIDNIKGGAMSFINNDITKAFIAILSLLSIFNSVVSLAGQTNERRLAARLQQFRRQPAAQPPVNRAPTHSASAARSASASRQGAAPRPTASARPASATRPSAQQRPATSRETARPQRSPYSRSPYQN